MYLNFYDVDGVLLQYETAFDVIKNNDNTINIMLLDINGTHDE